MTYVYSFAAAEALDVTVAGGKGAMLARLWQAGLPVPPGCIVTAAALQTYLAAQSHPLPTTDEARRDMLEHGVLPVALQESLPTLLGYLEPAPAGWAVRSSAVAEDGATASYAGMYDSFLNVSDDQLWSAIRACWASWWSARAHAYRSNLGETAATPQMAVVVQPMVSAQSAGVAFTVDPVSGNHARMVINAAPGLGDAVVSGVVEPEHYVLTKTTPVEIVETRLLRPDHPPLLSREHVTQLGVLLQRIEILCGSPQDIEWVWSGDQWWIVQSRPITTGVSSTAADDATVWSNANLKDVIPGLISPLGWSLMRDQLESSIRTQYAQMGYILPPEQPLIRRFWGRPYFNISVIQQAAYEFFGADPAEQVEQLGGAALRGFTPPPDPPSLRQRIRWHWNGMRVFHTLNRIRRGAPARFAVLEQRWQDERQCIPHFTTDEVLQALATRAEQDRPFLILHLYLTWGMNGYFTHLRQLVTQGVPDAPGGLCAELVTGLGDVTSADHSYALWELSRLARRLPDVMDFLARRDWSTWPETFADTPFAAPWDEFLATFGHRGLYEVEVGNPRWREQPGYLLDILATYSTLAYDKAPFDPQQQAQRRQAAEAEVLGRLAAWRRPWFRTVLRGAQEFSRWRECSKSHFVRLIDLGRLLALRAGTLLVQRGILPERDAIFLLEIAEVMAALRGEIGQEAINHLITQRRVERQRYAALQPPEAFIGSRPYYAEQHTAPDTALTGLPSNPGRVTGTARVLRSLQERHRLQPGNILVAPSTDPGWTPLFLLASGLVMETGGYLSHGAIVAREYGIPAVLNVTRATQRIPDGSTITIDGAAGTIQLATPPEASR
jgi:pyruvate,water dikinase